MTFDEAWSDHVDVMIDDTPTYVISRGNLIKNKLAAGREQDILDVKQIQEAAVPGSYRPVLRFGDNSVQIGAGTSSILPQFIPQGDFLIVSDSLCATLGCQPFCINH